MLTHKQVECLRDARFVADRDVPRQFRSIGGWNYGSTTIAVLKRAGFIERDYESDFSSRYLITTAGRAALAYMDQGGK